MAVAKLDKRVADLESRAGALVERMDAAAGRYLEAVTPWAAAQFEAAVDAAVRAAPDVTQEQGGDRLRGLRQGLEALVAGTPDLVRRRVGTPGAWPHRWTGRTVEAGLYGQKGAAGKRTVTVPPFLDARLRLLLGSAGHLLARHGYEHHVRRTFSRAYLRSDYHPPEYLARSLPGHEQCHEPLAVYGDLCDEYAGVLADLQVAGRDREVRVAADLWKQA